MDFTDIFNFIYYLRIFSNRYAHTLYRAGYTPLDYVVCDGAAYHCKFHTGSPGRGNKAAFVRIVGGLRYPVVRAKCPLYGLAVSLC